MMYLFNKIVGNSVRLNCLMFTDICDVCIEIATSHNVIIDIFHISFLTLILMDYSVSLWVLSLTVRSEFPI